MSLSLNLVLVLDPAIYKNEGYTPYQEGITNDIFIKVLIKWLVRLKINVVAHL